MVDGEKVMASRYLRRSGIAVGLVAECYGFIPDTVFQVGIGVNHEEVDVLKSEWPEVKWVGCEPNPVTYKSIANIYPGITFQVALSNRLGEADLCFARIHKDGATLCTPRPDQPNKITVPTTTLDALREEYGSFGSKMLLWLDCEGSEYRVLQGAEEFIKDVAWLNVELTAKPQSEDWCRPEQVDGWLRSHGFARTWTHTHRLNIGQYDCIYLRRELLNPNFCCCPCELTGNALGLENNKLGETCDRKSTDGEAQVGQC